MSNAITQIALRFNGVKEVGINRGVTDATLEHAMKNVGWSAGQAWCLAYGIAIWSMAYTNPQTLTAIRKLGLGTQRAWAIAESLGFKRGRVPMPGAIAIFRSGGPGSSQGHAAIVLTDNGNTFDTVEGNTSESGSRSGDGIYSHARQLVFGKPQTGSSLELLGFIYAPYGATGGSMLAGNGGIWGVVMAASAVVSGFMLARGSGSARGSAPRIVADAADEFPRSDIHHDY